MKRIRYSVAVSLDGYIAGPNGESDWIPVDPDIDFRQIFEQFDTLLMGRKTFEPMAESRSPPGSMFRAMRKYVFSRTLKQDDHPDVTIVGEDFADTLTALREAPGKDIWLFGGGLLFRSLLDAGFVDTVEVAVIPVLLGGGIPLLPAPATRTRLELSGRRVYDTSGIVALDYAVRGASA